MLGIELCSPCSYADALAPSMMVFGGGTFGRKSGFDEVMRKGLHDGIGGLRRKGTRSIASFLSLLILWAHSGKVARKRGLTKGLNGLAPWAWALQPLGL